MPVASRRSFRALDRVAPALRAASRSPYQLRIAASLLGLLVTLSGCGGTTSVLRTPRPAKPTIAADRAEARAKMEADASAVIADLARWRDGLPDAAAGRRVSNARDIIHAVAYGELGLQLRHSFVTRDAPDLLWDIKNAVGVAVRALVGYADGLADTGRGLTAVKFLEAVQGKRDFFRQDEQLDLSRKIQAFKASAGPIQAYQKARALAACEGGAPTAAQMLRDGAPGTGFRTKGDFKLPDRCEGAAGSVALRVRTEALDPALLAAVQGIAAANNLELDPAGEWTLRVELSWGKLERRIGDSSASVEVQTGFKTGPNPEIRSCQSRVQALESKVKSEVSASNSARNASSQARTVRANALQSAQSELASTRQRCQKLPATTRVAVTESKSYDTRQQIAAMDVGVKISYSRQGSKPLDASGTINAAALTIAHGAHPALGVSAASPPPPSEAEVRAKAYQLIAESVGSLAQSGARRIAKETLTAMQAARNGPCMAHAELTMRAYRADSKSLDSIRRNAKGQIDDHAFSDWAAANECLGLQPGLY